MPGFLVRSILVVEAAHREEVKEIGETLRREILRSPHYKGEWSGKKWARELLLLQPYKGRCGGKHGSSSRSEIFLQRALLLLLTCMTGERKLLPEILLH